MAVLGPNWVRVAVPLTLADAAFAEISTLPVLVDDVTVVV